MKNGENGTEGQDGGSHIESLMSQMGMDVDPVSNTDDEADTNEKTDENQEDLSVSNETDENKPGEDNTEINPELASLQEQVTGMEKRMADKDQFIKDLQEQVKANEAKTDEPDTDNDDEDEKDGFWEKPEETIKNMQEQIRIQNLQIQEAVYAGGVEDYFKTVNANDLKEAVSNDPEFAKSFNGSQEPYKVAYEYLTEKKTIQNKSLDDARAAMKAELLEEIKAEGAKTPPANINSIGSSSGGSSNNADDDGFAAVFKTQ